MISIARADLAKQHIAIAFDKAIFSARSLKICSMRGRDCPRWNLRY